MNYWLMKSEGDCYSIDDLAKDGVTEWSGVRNYQARNFMRDQMKVGDKVLFYHSNSTPSGIYGLAMICSEPYPDSTQFDKSSTDRMGYDPKSSRENPIWICIDVQFEGKFREPISLAQLKMDPSTMGMLVCQKGSRLSIQPVTKAQYQYIIKTYA